MTAVYYTLLSAYIKYNCNTYAVLEIDSSKQKYRKAIYKISINHVVRGGKIIPANVGFSEKKLPAELAEVAID